MSLSRRASGFASAVCLIASAVPALAETWQVREGARGEAHGTWQIVRRGNAISGNGTMAGPQGQRVTFGLAGEERSDGYVINRVASSDGMNCMYKGSGRGPDIANGMAVCNGRPSPWAATRR